MSENDEKPTKPEQFAQMFAEFMRTSIAHSKKAMIPTDSPPNQKSESYSFESSPLIIGEKLNGENYTTWGSHESGNQREGIDISHHGSPNPSGKDRPSFREMAASRPLRIYVVNLECGAETSQPSDPISNNQRYMDQSGGHLRKRRRQDSGIRLVCKSNNIKTEK